ncbi:uncharacterized protein LOC119305044 [Triticum dicoccoides]|uniref:uncharacterized protein LOC119305044 n=1 Tax=Triticum dicoccoides TaxID=85692 RepID=UPI00188E233E|nr:uncharacterized protein LOC119305044 [Triticum dicoccoides]XP_044368463.1 uncharacterized protein LOC123091123 [Triticum aestivum]
MTLCRHSVANTSPFASPSSVLDNYGEQCIQLEARRPFKNITNVPVVNSTTASKAKQGWCMDSSVVDQYGCSSNMKQVLVYLKRVKTYLNWTKALFFSQICAT